MVSDDLKQLKSTSSVKRRAAAKRLRKSGSAVVGDEILSVLRREIEDPRTWETQYHLIMALGQCGCTDALEFLTELTLMPFEASMIYVALGDAIFRLKSRSQNDSTPIVELIATENTMLIEGGLRALAMLKIVPNQKDIETILDFVSRSPSNDLIRVWPLAAAPGWEGASVSNFIAECMHSTEQEIVNAAQLAKAKKYRRWNPL